MGDWQELFSSISVEAKVAKNQRTLFAALSVDGVKTTSFLIPPGPGYVRVPSQTHWGSGPATCCALTDRPPLHGAVGWGAKHMAASYLGGRFTYEMPHKA